MEFQFRRYRLPLRVPVRTAHEVWTEREGVLVRLADGAGHVGYGEAAPIPAFGTETLDEIVEACRVLGENPTDATLSAVPGRLGTLRSAIAVAQAELATDRPERGSGETPDRAAYRGVAALLPAGRAVFDVLRTRAESGFRVFKWKVGVSDVADELALLEDVCANLPSGARLRLDANGAWNRRQAERWFERCADHPIEYIEQPCFAGANADATARGRADDLLLGLAHDYPTPVALDESVVRDGDVTRWLGSGWPGWFVLKPSLLGDAAGAIAQLRRAKANVVFSSALETAVGARSALRVAFAWDGEPKALGFGVWPLFADGRFEGPHAAPFIRREDVERLNPENVWNALS